MPTIETFIINHRVRFDWEYTASRPDADEWDAGANHYSVTIKCRRRRMSVPYSMGPALTDDPKLADVLDCLAIDSAAYENSNGSFEAWCDECGYATDSRKAERTFRQVEKQAKALRRVLGDDAYAQLLWRTNRL